MTSANQKAMEPPRGEDLFTSVSDFVTRTIREAIFQGKFRPGERLQQDRLAAQLRVSRQPVREALRRLQSEGLVVQLPQRWMAVQEFTEEAALENYRLRLLLEAEAARVAAGRIRPEEIEGLKAVNKTMARAVAAGSLDNVIALNAELHRRLRTATRMPTLVRFIEQLWVGRTIFTPLFVPGRARRSVEEHARLIAALEQRNARGAQAAMRDHISRASREYFDKSEHREPAEVRPRPAR